MFLAPVIPPLSCGMDNDFVQWLCSITPGCRSRMRTCGGQASLWQGDNRNTWRHLMFLLRNDTDHFHTVSMVKARQVAKYKVSGQESISLPRGRGKSIRERPGEQHLSNKDNKQFWKMIQTSYNYIERWKDTVSSRKTTCFVFKMPISVCFLEASAGESNPDVAAKCQIRNCVTIHILEPQNSKTPEIS